MTATIQFKEDEAIISWCSTKDRTEKIKRKLSKRLGCMPELLEIIHDDTDTDTDTDTDSDSSTSTVSSTQSIRWKRANGSKTSVCEKVLRKKLHMEVQSSFSIQCNRDDVRSTMLLF